MKHLDRLEAEGFDVVDIRPPEPSRTGAMSRVVRLCARIDPKHHCSVGCLTDLASALAELGDVRQAAKLREALPTFQPALGPDHPATLARAIKLAQDPMAVGQPADAKELAASAIERLRLGPAPTIRTCHRLGTGRRLDVSLDPTATF